MLGSVQEPGRAPMSNVLVVNVGPGQTRVALIAGGVVVEVHHETGGSGSLAGNVYKGRVVRVLPGMEAAFVEIGLERTAFLYVDDVGADTEELPYLADEERDGPEPILRPVMDDQPAPAVRERRPIEQQLRSGQEVVVQVAKGPIGSKGARVTTRLSIPGRMLVLMPHTDHVGVSRRIADPAERARLRDTVLDLRPPGVGFIVRTAAEGAAREQLRADIEVLIALWNDLVRTKDQARTPSMLYADLDLTLRSIRDLLTHDLDRVVIDSPAEFQRVSAFAGRVLPRLQHRVELYDGAEPIFDHFGIEHELARALSPSVWLRSGGYIVIEETEALTTVDVNTGRYVGRRNLDETILKTNLEAVPEIVYQLRLRNIGGIVIVDFIDMERPEHRAKVCRALEEALQRDRARTVVHPMSALGLVELTRKRVSASLRGTLTEPCRYCEGRGHVKSVSSLAFEVLREVCRVGRGVRTDSLGIHVHSSVADFLHEEGRPLLEEVEALLGKHTVTFPMARYHLEEYDVIGVDTGLRPERVLRAVPGIYEGD